MPKSLFPHATPEMRDRLEQDPTLKLINDYDWTKNPLGPIPDWPDSLKGSVRTMMVASTPMVMLIGEEAILIYNNAYAKFAGQRHPAIFGMPALQAWPEIADFNRGNIERGLRGESWMLRDQELVLNRHGQLESGWMDLNYSPIVGEDGRSMGTLCMVLETTDRVMAERALARSEERLTLALSGSNLVGTWDWDVVNDVVTSDDRFAALFNLDPLRAGLGVQIGEFMRAIHPDDAARVGAEIDAVMRGEGDFRSEYRVVSPGGEVRWVVASGRVRFDADGTAVRFPGIVVDLSEQKRVSEALSESELRFRTLADTMPQMVWSTLPDGFHDYYNARWYDFTGVPPGSTDGEGWNGMFHPDDQDRARKVWLNSLETGEPYQIEYRLRHHSGKYRWTLGRALPIRDADGQIVRWIGTCTDIHEQRRVAEERELVTQELSHRIKNIFAVLTGIVSLSARNDPSARPFAEQLRHRIYALGEAHDFTRPNHDQGADGKGQLSALIARLMRPYEEAGESARVRFTGQDLSIDDAAATPLALLFHELATNAAKYGALSKAGGTVTLEGRVEGDLYVMRWTERGGPKVSEPARVNGFGTRLIGMSVEGQMRGTLERVWHSDGLEATFSVPIDALSHSARLRSKPTEN